ncbi:Uncharacterized protein, DUF1810 family [Sphingomonas palmae]|uniref:Uncharacterized protein, DUF1810 family n=1 Tax=Sphingomonas palmae TaxID=1855283 RepID=A0A1H7S7A5_9SPHN|nr:DUF1810 domain-containing protein [Sphingomonas palmae]SEL68482.1 Uncharacterized protein, DUF1810 family [Sphingomonas palmae]
MQDARKAPADLDRFIAAQADSYGRALAELTAGHKQSHWMWFIFPQIAGLGHSPTAIRYAIHDLSESQAYLAHPLLGPRYLACCTALLRHRGRDARDIMGEIDAVKLRSSLTLFDAAGAAPIVAQTLAAFFPEPDQATLRLIGR